MTLLPVSLAALITAAAVMALAAVTARRVGRVAVVDVAWGLGFVAIAGVAALVGPGGARAWWLLVLVGIWGLRLAWHIHRRAVSPGHAGHDDPRYVAHLGGTLAQVGIAVAIRRVFGVQGLALWLVSWPLQAGAALPVAWPAVAVAGGVLWLVGLVFEVVGDAQLAAYRADPQRGPVLDRGLWAWTRHPNYFGDTCVWWGLWLVGGLASGWAAGLLTVVAPLAMTYFLVWATGARLLEQTMRQRPAYAEYAARTSFFVPRPPRRHGS